MSDLDFEELMDMSESIFNQCFKNKLDECEKQKQPIDQEWDDFPYFDESKFH